MPRIWVPKLKIHEVDGLRIGAARASGYFMLETLNRHSRVTRRKGPWKQIITDYGMDRIVGENTSHISTGGVHYSCRVGVGTTPFSPSSTSLSNSVAQTVQGADSSVEFDLTGDFDYRARYTVTRRFPLGAIQANLTEVGFFATTGTSTGTFLDLIRDELGNPTAFPVTSDDQLQVTHVLDVYPPLDDFAGSFVLGGNAGGSYDFLMRANNLQSEGPSGQARNIPRFRLGLTQSVYLLAGAVSDFGPANGSLFASPTEVPNASASTPWADPTNDGTVWTVARTYTLGLTEGNFATGAIAALREGSSTQSSSGASGFFKVLFDPPIPKFAGGIQRILSINLAASMERV